MKRIRGSKRYCNRIITDTVDGKETCGLKGGHYLKCVPRTEHTGPKEARA